MFGKGKGWGFKTVFETQSSQSLIKVFFDCHLRSRLRGERHLNPLPMGEDFTPRPLSSIVFSQSRARWNPDVFCEGAMILASLPPIHLR